MTFSYNNNNNNTNKQSLLDWLFQTKGEDVVKFVVDRRPSKALLTDARLWNVSETAAANTASDTAPRDDDVDDDISVDDVQRKHKRPRSDTVRDHSVEVSAAKMKISPPALGTSGEGSRPASKLHRDGKTKKREKEEHVTKTAGKVTKDCDFDSPTKADQDRKKHRSSVDDTNLRTHPLVGNLSEYSADVSKDESCSLVGSTHHSGKKCGKSRPKNSVDVSEGGASEQCFSGSENVESESPAVSVTTSMQVDQKLHHHKKRSKRSREDNFPTPTQTAGKDPSMELAVTCDVSEKMESTAGDNASNEVIKSSSTSASGCGKEIVDVVNEPGVRGAKLEHFFQLVMQDDDDDDDDDSADKVFSGSDVADSTQFKILSTPKRGVSNKGAKSPSTASKESYTAETSDETDVVSRVEKDCSSKSCLDPHVVLESPMTKKSPTKTTRCTGVMEDLPSSLDGSVDGQLTATEADLIVCIVQKLYLFIKYVYLLHFLQTFSRHLFF